MLGTALAEGKGYRLLNEPGEIHAVQYPPLLPMIVAAHQRIMGTSDYFKVGSLSGSPISRSRDYFCSWPMLWRANFCRLLYSFFVGAITALSFYSFLEPSDCFMPNFPLRGGNWFSALPTEDRSAASLQPQGATWCRRLSVADCRARAAFGMDDREPHSATISSGSVAGGDFRDPYPVLARARLASYHELTSTIIQPTRTSAQITITRT